MTTQQSDREDLNLLERYLAAHARCGTTPHQDSVIRYNQLVARVGMADRRAAA
jgi:hypothetical protein